MDAILHLRQECHRLHAQLEQASPIYKIFNTSSYDSVRYYSQYLHQLAQRYAALESWLHQAWVNQPDPLYQNRLPLLQEDLLALTDKNETFSFTINTPPPCINYLWGVRYVIEGSKHGNQIISKKLLSHPQPLIRNNLRFFTHSSPFSWPNFVKELNSHLNTQPAIEIATKGAIHTFQLFL